VNDVSVGKNFLARYCVSAGKETGYLSTFWGILEVLEVSMTIDQSTLHNKPECLNI